MNKTINIKNLKQLQNKIMNKQKNMSINKKKNNYNLRTLLEYRNKIEKKDKSSCNKFDKDNPTIQNNNNKNFNEIIHKKEKSFIKNNLKLKEILKLAGKEEKQKHSIFKMKSFIKNDKK